MENIYEETSRSIDETRKQTYCKVLFILSVVFMVISFFSMLFFLFFINAIFLNGTETQMETHQIIFSFTFAPSLVLAFVLFMLRNTFNVSYDYQLYENEFSVYKVFNDKKKKFLYRFNCEEIAQFGKVGSDSYNAVVAGGSPIVYLTPNKKFTANGKQKFYIVVNLSLGKKILIVEAKEQLIVELVKHGARKALETDYE